MYDVECLENDIITIIQNNLPAKLAEIDAEKNDGIVLETIPNSAYFHSLVNQDIVDDPFIHYMIKSSTPDDTNYVGVTARSYVMLIEVVLIDEQADDSARSRVNRYIRALREIIDANFRKSPNTSKLDIDEILPGDFTGNNDQSTFYKIGGIQVRTTITS